MPIYSQNLWKYLKNCGNLIDMSERFRIMENIFCGLIYIQNRGYKHLDIKLSNILLKTDSKTDKWDGRNCVITDFGIGGKTEKTVGMAGTPGFASPQQLIGNASETSDNYSIGRTMVFLFSTWQGAWNALYQPIPKDVIQSIQIEPVQHDIFLIISNLIKIEPTSRTYLELAFQQLLAVKKSLINIAPIELTINLLLSGLPEREIESNTFDFKQVGEKTQ